MELWGLGMVESLLSAGWCALASRALDHVPSLSGGGGGGLHVNGTFLTRLPCDGQQADLRVDRIVRT